MSLVARAARDKGAFDAFSDGITFATQIEEVYLRDLTNSKQASASNREAS